MAMSKRAQDLTSNKDFWIVILAFAGFMTGGFVGIGVAGAIPASLGGISTPEDIQVGTWFRYDLAQSRILTMSSLGWKTVGKPYVIVNCTARTTWDELDDKTAGASSRVAYNWSIKVFWESGLEAKELYNGSIRNDHYTFLMKVLMDAYTNASKTQTVSVYKYLRPHIDPKVPGWAGAEPFASSWTFFGSVYNHLPGLVQIGEIPIGYQITVFDGGTMKEIGGTFNENRTYGAEILYDPGTGILWSFAVADYNEQNSGYQQWIYLTAYGGKDIKKIYEIKTLVMPDPKLVIYKAYNMSFEYELCINALFETARINITSNDTGAFKNVTNAMADRTIFPLDIDGNVELNITVITKYIYFVSNPVSILVVLKYPYAGNRISPVTLDSVVKIGNSLNITWTGNKNAFQYRIFINDTQFGGAVTENNTIIRPDMEGDLNITVVADSRKYMHSSLPSNGIIVSFASEGKNATDYGFVEDKVAGDPPGTYIPPNDTPAIVSGIVGIVCLSAGVLVLFFNRRKITSGLRNISARSSTSKKSDGTINKYRSK